MVAWIHGQLKQEPTVRKCVSSVALVLPKTTCIQPLQH